MNSSSTYSSFFPPASTAPIELTYSDAQALVSGEIVKKGQLYIITDRADTGIYLIGLDSTHFEEEAIGGFLNADFQGVGDYSGVEAITLTTWIAPNYGIYVSANEEYNAGHGVIWNNINYQVISKEAQNNTTPDINTGAFYPLPKSLTTGYILEYDKIIYDLVSDTILWRMDKRNNKINNASLATWDWGNDGSSDFRQETIEVIEALNNSGTISGIQSSQHKPVLINNNSGLIVLNIQGYLADSIVGNNNSGRIVIQVYSSVVTFNNNSGDISGCYADGANWNYDNNTEDWVDVDATNGSNGNITVPTFFGEQGGAQSKYLQNNNQGGWNTLLAENRLPKGKFIFINNDDISTPTDLGIRIFCETKNQFALRASGGFLNPDYRAVGEYSGVVDITNIEINGSNQGVWQRGIENGYEVGIVIIWNGLHYQVIELDPQGTDPTINTQMYQVLPKSAPNVGYIEEWDDIEYDFANNYLMSRSDKLGAIIRDDAIDGTGTIALYQWGNDNVRANIVEVGSQLSCINQTGSMLSNRLSGGSIVDASTNAGGINNNTFANSSNLVLNITNSRNIGGCLFDSAATYDLSGINVDYYRKTLSPHLSTFDANINSSSQAGESQLIIPDYIGVIYITGGGTTFQDFTTTPSFKRTFYAVDNTQSFANLSTLKFPSTAISTQIQNNSMDFIEFLWVASANKFIQTASEQY